MSRRVGPRPRGCAGVSRSEYPRGVEDILLDTQEEMKIKIPMFNYSFMNNTLSPRERESVVGSSLELFRFAVNFGCHSVGSGSLLSCVSETRGKQKHIFSHISWSLFPRECGYGYLTVNRSEHFLSHCTLQLIYVSQTVVIVIRFLTEAISRHYCTSRKYHAPVRRPKRQHNRFLINAKSTKQQ